MISTDCLLLGFYDLPFPEYVEMVRSLGEESGSYRDLALAFMDYEGQPYRALDILNHFYNKQHNLSGVTFHNADFVWPVITYLLTFLRRRGLNVDYVNLPHLQTEELKRKLTRGNVRSVAITTTLYVSPEPILELVAFVRRWCPTAEIIVGGPYISNQARAVPRPGLTRLLSTLGADIYVLCQEGEATLAAVLGAIQKGTSLDFVPNLAFTSDRKNYTFTLDQPESNKLSEEMVDYHLFPGGQLGEFVTTRTAKSCPFACAFCGFPSRAGAYTYLELDHVERELDAIAEQKQVTTVTILDDTFNVPKARFREILRMMIRKEYRFKWNSFYRSDHGDEETIRLMARAGCEGVFLGIESGSDLMLSRMNKTARRQHYSDSIAVFSANNISTYASLIIGFPGETNETVEETISLIEEARPDYYRAQLWYADPVTPIWKEREKYGVTGQGFLWKHDTMDAERACDWIERIFLSINNSTWLPQFGFEQWSTFYLQRKGMSEAGVKRFVTAFNAAIKHRMVSFGAPLHSEILTALQKSCDFDNHSDVSSGLLQRWSGKTYRKASDVLAAEMTGARSAYAMRQKSQGELRCVETKKSEVPQLLHTLRVDAAERNAVLLAAYAAAIKKRGGDEVILVSLGSAAAELPVPMRFRSAAGEPFEVWVEEARQKISMLMPYSHLLMSVFESPLWRSKYGHEGLQGNRLFRLLSEPVKEDPHWMSLLDKWGVSEIVMAESSHDCLAFTRFAAGIGGTNQKTQLLELNAHLQGYALSYIA
jgi:anaerobic magnesium-protoporphyrin IX monomethyl ester cyclase